MAAGAAIMVRHIGGKIKKEKDWRISSSPNTTTASSEVTNEQDEQEEWPQSQRQGEGIVAEALANQAVHRFFFLRGFQTSGAKRFPLKNNLAQITAAIFAKACGLFRLVEKAGRLLFQKNSPSMLFRRLDRNSLPRFANR